jgi:hypothetical protein
MNERVLIPPLLLRFESKNTSLASLDTAKKADLCFSSVKATPTRKVRGAIFSMPVGLLFDLNLAWV